MLGAKCGFAPSYDFLLCKPRILLALLRKSSDRAECFAQTSPTKQAQWITFFLHGTRIRILATRSDTQLPYLRETVSYIACEDQTKACVYARLPRRAKLADSAEHMRFVCAILGLSRIARIRGLRKKILGWCKSALCA